MLKVAINRLNNFCTPKLHKLASKAEFSAGDRTHVIGGEITIAAPTGITCTNVARVQLLQAALLESLVAYLAKESQGAKVEEVHS